MDVEGVSEKLRELVVDENRIVTYKTLSKACSIHVSSAKKALEQFLDSQTGLNATFILTGFIKNGEKPENTGYHVAVVPEDKLEKVRQTFSQLDSCHVYSIQKTVIKDSSVLYSATCDDLGIKGQERPKSVIQNPPLIQSKRVPHIVHKPMSSSQPVKKIPLAPIHSHKEQTESKGYNKTLSLQRSLIMSPMEITKEKISTDNSPQQKEKISADSSPQQKANAEISKVQEKGSDVKVKISIHNDISVDEKENSDFDFFSSGESSKVGDSSSEDDHNTAVSLCISEKRRPMRTTSKSKGGIMAAFARGAGVNNKKKENEKPPNNNSELKNGEVEDEKEKSGTELKPLQSNPTLTRNRKPTDSKKNSKKTSSQTKKTSSDTKNQLKMAKKEMWSSSSSNESSDEEAVPVKRSRIKQRALSDSEDENDQKPAALSETPKDEEDPLPVRRADVHMLSDDDEEDVIPPTPEAMKISRQSVTVKNTYEDEDGYLVTKKEQTLEEIKESPVPASPVVQRGPGKPVTKSRNVSQTQNKKKKSPPEGQKKQASLMSFFTKK